MTIQELLEAKNMSIYKLAQQSNIPYATCNDIVKEKTQLTKCSAGTVYRIARALDVSMEDLLSSYLDKRSSFDNFKSTVCHKVKEMGDIDFILSTLEHDDINKYYQRKWYPECLYLLAMLDYLSRENDIPICGEYDEIRKCSLEKPVYPSSILAISISSKNDLVLKEALQASIPEFKRFNIVESEIRNVI